MIPKILFALWVGFGLVETATGLLAQNQPKSDPPPLLQSHAQLIGRYEFSTQGFLSDIQYLASSDRIAAVLSDSRSPLTFWNLKIKTCLQVDSPKAGDYHGPLSVSADGRRLAACVFKGICILDAHDGTLLKTLSLPESVSTTASIALSSDGSKLLIMNSLSDWTTRQLVVMDWEKEKLLAENKMVGASFSNISFGLDDSTALFIDHDFTGTREKGSSLIRWNFQTDVNCTLRESTRGNGFSTFQALSENRIATVLAYVENRRLTEVAYVLWNPSNGQELVRIPLDLRNHFTEISNDGRRVISIAEGNAIVTDLNETLSSIQSRYQFDAPWSINIWKLRLSPNGDDLFLALTGGTIQHWKLPRGDSKSELDSVSFRTENEPAPSVTLDVPWNPKNRRIDLSDGLISNVSMLDEDTLIALDNDGDMYLHRWKTDEVVASDHLSQRNDSSTDHRLAIGADGQSFLWSRTRIANLKEPFAFVYECSVWQREPLRQKALLPGVNSTISALVTSLDGRWAAAGGDQQDIIVWDLATCTEYFRVAQENGANHLGCFALEFSADGQYLIAATKKGLTQWSLSEKSQVRQSGHHSQGILRLRPQHPDELLCTQRSGLMIRSLPNLNPTPWNLDHQIEFASFSKDGNRLALYGPNGLEVVDVPHSKTLLSRTEPKSLTQPAVLSPDGSTVIIAMGGHLILMPVDE